MWRRTFNLSMLESNSFRLFFQIKKKQYRIDNNINITSFHSIYRILIVNQMTFVVNLIVVVTELASFARPTKEKFVENQRGKMIDSTVFFSVDFDVLFDNINFELQQKKAINKLTITLTPTKKKTTNRSETGTFN